MIKKDLGFVIKKTNFRETSVIASLFTRKFGRITGILKGFYPVRKEFTTSMETGTLNEFVFYPKRSSIWLVSYADLLRDYHYLTPDREKSFVVSRFMDIIGAAMPLWERNHRVFDLLYLSLESFTSGNARKILYIFFIKFLDLCGLKPEFTSCIVCRRPVEGNVFFSSSKGGLLCFRCGKEFRQAELITGQIVSSIRYIQKNDFPLVLRIQLSRRCEEDMLRILNSFLLYHLKFTLAAGNPAYSLAA